MMFKLNLKRGKMAGENGKENGMENGKINSQNSILFAKATNTKQMTSFMREKLSEAMCEMRQGH